MRTVEPAGREPRQRRGLPRLERRRACRDLRPHGALGEACERNELAARQDRLRQRAEIVRDEDDHRVRRRLLQILEQRVGGILVHRLRGVEEIDAALGLEGPHVQVAAQLTDVVDADLVADRLEQVDVRVRPALHAVRLADELSREGDGRRALAHAGRSVEEVRVRGAIGERGAQQPLRLGLLRKGLEGVHGSPRRRRRVAGCRPRS